MIGGGKLEGILVDAPVEEALIRAEKRGELTGRYEDAYNILNNHAVVPKKLASLLSEFQERSIIYSLYDNTRNLTKTAEVDLFNKMIAIFDHDKLLNFLGKVNLNISSSIDNNQIIYNQINIEDGVYQRISADYKIVNYCLSDFDF